MLIVTVHCVLVLSASPVGPMFQTNCTEQQGRHRHDIRCEPDGTFSRVQCMGPKCFCVTPDTGERINSETFSRSRINSMPCSTVGMLKK